jgi:hypothetical protein
MTPTLTKSVIALVPAAMLLVGSARIFFRVKAASTLLQLLGASGIVVVALTHVCEALHLLPWMNWGLENSAGHYLDLASALVGITLFPIGYLAFAVSRLAP